MPGDEVQIVNGDLYINNIRIKKQLLKKDIDINCGDEVIKTDFYKEILPNGREYIAVYRIEGSMANTDQFIVPDNHYFFMGDNRDCSKDSRYLSSVGYVNFNNLVGKAQIIFFSNDKEEGSFLKIWKWHKSIRFNRFFKRIK